MYTQAHCVTVIHYTFLMNSRQLPNVSDEDLEEHVRTQPLKAMNWEEHNSRIFFVLTFPELINIAFAGFLYIQSRRFPV
jgi:hypothetical protein